WLEPVGLVDLRRQEIAIAIEPETEIEAQPLRHAPRVADVQAVGPQAVHRSRRVPEQVHLERRAAAKNVNDVAKRSRRIALLDRVAEDLPADLEIVVAVPAVPEIADRPEHLVAPNIQLADPRRAGYLVVSEIFVSRRRRVVRVGPVEPVLTAADLEEQRIADNRIQLALVQARIEPLIERRVLRRENAGQPERERIQPVR